MPRRWTSVRCEGKRRGENSLRQTIEAAQGATCWGTNCRTSRSITWLKSPKTTDIMEWLQQYIPSAFCGFLRLQWLPHMWHADYFVPGLFVSVSLNHYSINMLVMSTCFQIFQGSRHTLLNVVWPIVVFILPHPTALIVLACSCNEWPKHQPVVLHDRQRWGIERWCSAGRNLDKMAGGVVLLCERLVKPVSMNRHMMPHV